MTATLYFPTEQGEGKEIRKRFTEQQHFDELYPFDDGIGDVEREVMELLSRSVIDEATRMFEGVGYYD